MKQSINSHDFHRAFEQLRPNNFSYDGLSVLFDYLEQCEEDCDTEIELDVIAICCDYSEYTIAEAKAGYGSYYDDVEAATDMDELVNAFSDQTWVLRVDEERLIIAAF